jgi:hypothetical protein
MSKLFSNSLINLLINRHDYSLKVNRSDKNIGIISDNCKIYRSLLNFHNDSIQKGKLKTFKLNYLYHNIHLNKAKLQNIHKNDSYDIQKNNDSFPDKIKSIKELKNGKSSFENLTLYPLKQCKLIKKMNINSKVIILQKYPLILKNISTNNLLSKYSMNDSSSNIDNNNIKNKIKINEIEKQNVNYNKKYINRLKNSFLNNGDSMTINIKKAKFQKPKIFNLSYYKLKKQLKYSKIYTLFGKKPKDKTLSSNKIIKSVKNLEYPGNVFDSIQEKRKNYLLNKTSRHIYHNKRRILFYDKKNVEKSVNKSSSDSKSILLNKYKNH